MSDYPKSLPEFQELFPDEDTCATGLFEMRWPDGFECPACGHKECCALTTRKWLYQCKSCRKQTSFGVNVLSKVAPFSRPIMTLPAGRKDSWRGAAAGPARRTNQPCGATSNLGKRMTALTVPF